MTDKQIIINGCNVSGCEAYKDKHCKDKTSIMFCKTNLCSNFPNCYYKQHKRKEQKIDKAKLLLQTIIETNKIYPLQNNLLKLLDIIEGKENE